jgi:hypothetical protein
VIRQLVGRSAALDVVADEQQLTAAEAAALREPNRLDWCVRVTKQGPDMRWPGSTHPKDCPHPHVIDHQCTAPIAPTRPARTTRRRPTPVPAGQLTL